MANTTKNMQQIRHILQLRAQGIGIREIVQRCGISRPTVRVYLRRWEAMGLPWDALHTLDDEGLGALMYQEAAPAVDPARWEVLQARLPTILRELGRVGVTRQLLWEEYRRDHPQGYAYTQFCQHLRAFGQRRDAVMHFDHKAGERLLIDFAGKKLSYVDVQSGELLEGEVLVAVLPFSNFCYVEAVRSQRLEDFLGAIANALAYLGGVPQAALIDNLKSGVIKPDRYEPTLTELLEQLSVHYGCTFMATRVAKPRDKATVERSVQIVYERVYAPMRNEAPTSLSALNAAIRQRLDAHHARPFQQRREECRQSLFDAVERPTLRPLPRTAFEVKYSGSYKVQRNYHVQLGCDRHFYSVPYAHIGQQVLVVYTRDTVEIYADQRRIAFHARDRRAHAYTTLAEHMPPNHQHYTQIKGYSGQYFQERAARIGGACMAVVEALLSAKIFHEQAYNSCLGLLRLADKFTPERLERACSRALRAAKPSYLMVLNILRNNLDQLERPVDPSQHVSRTPSDHANVRGPQAYR
jgi:transposase